jgi:signal peptidase I
MVLLLIFTALISILSGCADSITDTKTEKKIKIVQNPTPSLIKVKVETDGMAGGSVYDHPHPFGMGNEVLVDSNYYEKNEVSRGDIVLFKTKNNQKDVARIVGLPGESVRIKKGQVYINEKKLDTFYGNDPTSSSNDSMDKPLKMKENEYFILADVRWRGFNDSQSEGAFVKESILGKVVGFEEK